MNQPLLSEIYIYPVKSLTGFKVLNWPVNEKGLLHDRKWMLIDRNNQFLSQRRIPRMALIKTEIIKQELKLSTKSSGAISVPLNPEEGHQIITTIWKDQCPAKTTSKVADHWLSEFLDIECQLVYQADKTIRSVDQNYAHATDKVNFSDGFPFLIVSESSLNALNQELDSPIPIQRFRPNLVISNCESYAEDSWRQISINDISFRLPKPCSRCSVPTIDLESAKTNKEPLSTLNRTRKWNKQVFFGQNALHDNSGELLVGNSVTINQSGPRQPPL